MGTEGNGLSDETKQHIKNCYGRGFERRFEEMIFEFGRLGYTEEQSEELAWYSFVE